jgi:hypothetical protein
MDNDIDLVPPYDPRGEALKKEMERSSLDVIRVYNPTNRDYVLDWDGFKHRIPAKQQKSLQRYLASKYCREMKNQLINEMADKELDNLKQTLIDKGDTDAVYNANDRFQRQSKYRTNDIELIKKIYKDIWLGVESAYGRDDMEPEKAENSKLYASAEDEVLASMNMEYREPEEIKLSDYPINKKKDIDKEI